MNTVRVGFGISFVLSYTIIIFEARHNVDLLVHGHIPYSFRRYLKLNIVLVSLTATVGILAPNIDVVLGLVGSTCSPMMMFVLPALFGLCSDNRSWLHPAKRGALLLFIFGSALIPTCTIIWAACDVAKAGWCG